MGYVAATVFPGEPCIGGNWRDPRGNQRNCRAFGEFPVLATNADDSVIRGPTVQSSYESTAPRAQTLAIATPACVSNTPPRKRLDRKSRKPPSAGEIPANTGVLISASWGPRPQRIGYSRKRVNSTLAHGLYVCFSIGAANAYNDAEIPVKSPHCWGYPEGLQPFNLNAGISVAGSWAPPASRYRVAAEHQRNKGGFLATERMGFGPAERAQSKARP